MHDPVSLPMGEDLIQQHLVLGLVIREAPTFLTEEEIVRELDSEDASQRAVRDLIGAGLMRREGAILLPTRAAVQANRIDGVR